MLLMGYCTKSNLSPEVQYRSSASGNPVLSAESGFSVSNSLSSVSFH